MNAFEPIKEVMPDFYSNDPFSFEVIEYWLAHANKLGLKLTHVMLTSVAVQEAQMKVRQWPNRYLEHWELISDEECIEEGHCGKLYGLKLISDIGSPHGKGLSRPHFAAYAIVTH